MSLVDDSSETNNEMVPIKFERLNLSECGKKKPKFKINPRLCVSNNNSVCSSSDCDSIINSSQLHSSTKSLYKKGNIQKGYAYKLPPLGIFWDIENVSVPKLKSASAVVQKIREVFLEDYRESEFIVVCDVKKESSQIIQELHDSQVNLIHVNAISKNAADEKLRQSLRRFADVHPAPSAILLISSDINFASDLSDLRYRKKIRIILIHNVNVADALILCANEHHSFIDLTQTLPIFDGRKLSEEIAYFLTVSNLPKHVETARIRNRLKYLVNNCGGKFIDYLNAQGIASLKFGTFDLALRAYKRIQGEDVYGQKIKVQPPSLRSYTGQRIKNSSRSNTPLLSNNADNNHLNSQFLNYEGKNANFYSYNNSSIRSAGSTPCVSPMEISYDQLQTGFIKKKFHRTNSEFSDTEQISCKENRPVDLSITNLDPTIDPKELKSHLINMIKEYAMILNLNISSQSDGTLIANLKVSTQQEAQFLISQLHRQKLGHKRIVISYEHNNSPDPEQLILMVLNILRDVPDKRMPLFTLMELLESRYCCTVSVSEVNKLKNLVRIRDERGSRMISLTEDALRISPSYNLTQTLLPHCVIHSPKKLENIGWCELNTPTLPNIMIKLSLFTAKVLTLLNVHFGTMPLLSFQNCFEQVFEEQLPEFENGVPLEHLITCIPNVDIQLGGPKKTIKVIKHEIKHHHLSEPGGEEKMFKTLAPSLAPNIQLFCREVVDLLKNIDKCQILLTKFIPAYHHQFGRQCRVADYGFTKLLDLLEAISHIVQIMGDGHRRVITLTHNTQMRRFTSDLLRVLKVQTNRQLVIQEFGTAYEKVLNKPFNPIEYGLCTVEDLLKEIPDNTAVISKDDENVVYISLPKKEQTAEEISKTRQFANEIKEIPNGERAISLTLHQSLKILSSQVLQVIRNIGGTVKVEELPLYYLREFGYPLNPQVYQCETLEEVIRLLSEYVQVVHSNAGSLLRPIEMDTLPNILKVRCWALLLSPPHVLDLLIFRKKYRQCYGNNFTLDSLKSISNIISLSTMNQTEFISLTPLYVLAAQLYYIICSSDGSVEFNQLEQKYEEYYGTALKLTSFGINSVNEFYNRFNLMFYIRGSKKNSAVVLNKNLQEHIAFKNDYNLLDEATSEGFVGMDQTKKYSPPKPDTPPTPGSVTWWNTPLKSDHTMGFTINMPSLAIDSKMFNNVENLISPARYLLDLEHNPWHSINTTPKKNAAPEPHEVPLPNKLLPPKTKYDDSGDSGVNINLENSPSDTEHEHYSMKNTGAIKKVPFQGSYLKFK